MSTLETKKIEPLSGTSVTLGAAGDAVTMPAGVTVKTNTVKDAGGNTIWTSDGSGTLSSVNAGLKGGMNFISTQTVSGSASISFTSGLTSTYDSYMFVMTNINPASDNVIFTFQGSIDGGSNYNVTITSTQFVAHHAETGWSSNLWYQGAGDQAQGTAYQRLNQELGNAADECCSGILHLYSPSNTTYVKHWSAVVPSMTADNQNFNFWTAGYFNTTSAINAMDFKMSSGNLDGTIAMYGMA